MLLHVIGISTKNGKQCIHQTIDSTDVYIAFSLFDVISKLSGIENQRQLISPFIETMNNKYDYEYEVTEFLYHICTGFFDANNVTQACYLFNEQHQFGLATEEIMFGVASSKTIAKHVCEIFIESYN